MKDQGSPPVCFTVDDGALTQRLDSFLPAKLKQAGKDVSRANVQEWIRSGQVSVAGNTARKPKHPVNPGDEICVSIPPKKKTELRAEDIPLTILFEDEHIVVIDKPCGKVVHPGAGNESGTVVNALLFHCRGKLSKKADDDRPGIVHRLDKDTSGCLIAAKSDSAYDSLVSQFSGRTTRKEYIAILDGIPGSSKGRIENNIGRNPHQRRQMTVLTPPEGKTAITEFVLEKSSEEEHWSRVRCRILTGRTHQIRVHMKESLHCAILGDPVYSKPARQRCKVKRLMLHAHLLRIAHPVTGREMTFEAEIPNEFRDFT